MCVLFYRTNYKFVVSFFSSLFQARLHVRSKPRSARKIHTRGISTWLGLQRTYSRILLFFLEEIKVKTARRITRKRTLLDLSAFFFLSHFSVHVCSVTQASKSLFVLVLPLTHLNSHSQLVLSYT